ncbi:beta subunit of N-acylethanolamine-hydrolyzing acid amidase-domain-containing protein [Immersiella caudata]|uniref:ceramidase n=1 Tax=Immersiella caudata TaxID=314043 RepID=A0AA39WLP1_9PEZI|nr:beta subunit of N-acylethanolamine-hydrolyzing acid amidase-domain-containing protein [Immersiella caudata]
MGLQDTLHFDREAYQRKLTARSTADLRKHEVIKTRQQVSAGTAMASGIGLAIFTLGKSLTVTAYGARRMYVADGKLELIKAELRRRGEELHTIRASDVFVPVGISVATLGVSAGLDGFLDGATAHLHHAIDSAAAGHSTQAVAEAVLGDPGQFLHGAVDGIGKQAHEVASFLHAAGAGGSTDTVATSAIDASIAHAGPGVLKGIEVGVNYAHSAEIKAASWITGLRRRAAAQKAEESTEPPVSRATAGHEPPRFTVDLSVAPEHRYDHIVPHLRSAIEDTDVAAQLNEVFEFVFPEMPLAQKCMHSLARIALRRVYNDEENAEIRGIARASGLPMYLLVALNVSLDVLLGCTSGGVRYQPDSKSPTRILHFRTLDWTMDPLRNLIIELDYVQHASGPVIATTVGYLGYVGVLTGVRKGLSMSLNYRPHHDGTTLAKRLAFRYHQLLVILGRRPSVSSTLRSFLLPPSPSQTPSPPKSPPSPPPSLPSILTTLSTSPSTAAYLIFVTPQQIHSVEKDHHSSNATTSSTFLTTCNHDLVDEQDKVQIKRMAEEIPPETPMEWLVQDSWVRKYIIGKKYEGIVKAGGKDRKKKRKEGDGEAWGVSFEEVIDMVNTGEISNEMTHYAVVMDPEKGAVVWRRAYEVGELEREEDDSEEETR